MDWSHRGRRQVTLDDGAVVVVRRVTGMEIATSQGALPTYVGGWDGYASRATAGERTPEDIAAAVKYDQFFLATGTVDPRIWPYEMERMPEGHVHVSAFSGPEVHRIIRAIMVASDFASSEEVAADAANFPGIPAGGVGGSGGGSVRDDAVGVPVEAGGTGGA